MSRIDRACGAVRDVWRGCKGHVVFLLVICFAAGTTGCMSSGIDALRMDPYRPETRRAGDWYEHAHPSRVQVQVADVPRETRVSNATLPAQRASVQEDTPEPVGTQEPGNSPDPDEPMRALEKGDRVTIQLDGPESRRIEDVIDDLGTVTLPHIDAVRLAGRTTSEAEAAIEKAYIDGKIFKYINVIVVSLDDEFFVRGEVNKEGRFPLTGSMTLGKALIVAGGYTEFAKPKEIKIRRGNKVLTFDMKKIDKGEAPDPLIRRGDVIVVPRRWVW